ncbi:MAG TPA: hypothetical protein VEP91_03405 [Solirubrobacterales bacterium]|nr:hypothetical protein [Solirubrobacterales bacterium]
MRIRVLAVVLVVAALIGGGTASASVKMPFGWARKQSKAFMDDYCIHHPSCVWWKVGHCSRMAYSRVDCGAAVEYRSGEFCGLIVVNKATNDGYLKQWVRRVRCE